MANEPHDVGRTIWQSQPPEPASVSLAELRGRARSLQATVWWRNLREYAAGALVAASFAYYLWRFRTPLVRGGALLSIAGALYVVYQLHVHGAARSVPAEMALNTCLAFHRRELERQRDLLRGVWRWYLLPLALFLAGLAVEQLAGRWAFAAAVAVVCAVGFFLVGRINDAAARSLQRQIDVLRDLEQGP